MDVKTRASLDRKAKERAKLGSDVVAYVENPRTNADFEDHYKTERRLKYAVRKLINMRTNRMLDILGYTSTEKDAKRLEYALKSFGPENILLQKKLAQMSFRSDESIDPGQNSLQTFFGVEGGKAIEERITQLGMGIPKLDNDLGKLQHEI